MLERAKSLLAGALSTNEEVDNKKLEELEEKLNCPCIRDAKDRTKVEVVGRIRSTTFFPGIPMRYAAELHDGTGQLTLSFLGRRRVPGVEPGRLMRVRGRILAGAPRQIINPWYELLDEGPSS